MVEHSEWSNKVKILHQSIALYNINIVPVATCQPLALTGKDRVGQTTETLRQLQEGQWTFELRVY